MNCPNVRYDTQNLFSNPCSCSQQNIELDDNVRLRYGNPTGFPRIADRDITNFAPANNDPQAYNFATGQQSNLLRYYPSDAAIKEKPTKNFVNLGYTSPAQWKRKHGGSNPPQPPQQSSGTVHEGYTPIPTSATNATFGPQYGNVLDDEQRKTAKFTNSKPMKTTREGFVNVCSNKSAIIISVVVAIAVLALIIYFSTRKCCKPCPSRVDAINIGEYPMA